MFDHGRPPLRLTTRPRKLLRSCLGDLTLEVTLVLSRVLIAEAAPLASRDLTTKVTPLLYRHITSQVTLLLFQILTAEVFRSCQRSFNDRRPPRWSSAVVLNLTTESPLRRLRVEKRGQVSPPRCELHPTSGTLSPQVSPQYRLPGGPLAQNTDATRAVTAVILYRDLDHRRAGVSPGVARRTNWQPSGRG